VTQPAVLEGTCHCGACRIRIPRSPEEVVECNCSLCRKTGWRGIYFSPSEVEVSGEFDSYVRADLDEQYLRTMRCKDCGIATHWVLLSPPPHERMGVNARLFDAALLSGVAVKHVDGASW
jgi:hypothetical protein